MKKTLKRCSIFVVLILVVSFALAGCGQKKDLTGKWQLSSVSYSGVSIDADALKAEGVDLSKIGFEIKNDTDVQFTQFIQLFNSATETILKKSGITEDQVKAFLPLIEAGLEAAGIKGADIEKYYNDVQTQKYELKDDQFTIKADDQELLSGTLKDDNTIVVSDFCMKGLELTFVRAK